MCVRACVRACVCVCVCVCNCIAFFSFTLCFSVFPKLWLKILFGVITATVNVALSCLNKDKKLENEDLQMNGNTEPNITFLVQDLITREEHGYEKVDHLLKLGQNSKTLWTQNNIVTEVLPFILG